MESRQRILWTFAIGECPVGESLIGEIREPQIFWIEARILSVIWERMICLWNSEEAIATLLGNSSILNQQSTRTVHGWPEKQRKFTVTRSRTVTVPVQFSSRELVDRFQFLELELGSQFFKKELVVVWRMGSSSNQPATVPFSKNWYTSSSSRNWNRSPSSNELWTGFYELELSQS